MVPVMAEDPMFFTTMLNELTRLALVGLPAAEMEVICMVVLWELPFTSPKTELVTIPPTASTAPTMMNRSRDWEIALRLQLIFIEALVAQPI